MKKLERVHELRGRFQNWSNAMRSSATTHMTGKFVKYVFDDFGLLRDVVRHRKGGEIRDMYYLQ